MPKRKSFKQNIAEMEPEVRLAMAKECVKDLTYRVQIVLHAYATCEHVCYGNSIASRIPPSRAATAFDLFRDGIFEYMVIRLVALWDPPNENAISIPQALALIDDSRVIGMIASETFEAFAGRGVRHLNPSNDPKIQAEIEREVVHHQVTFAMTQAEKAERSLKACIAAAQDLQSSEIEQGLRNLRDRVTHSVTRTRREGEGRDHRARYGYEKKMLHTTIAIIEELYCRVNGTSFDISGDCLEDARQAASEFWNSIVFLQNGEIS